jgi:hypothetical protein
MHNRKIIEAWKNKKLRSESGAQVPNPAGSSEVALKHIQQTFLITSPHVACSIGPKCPY